MDGFPRQDAMVRGGDEAAGTVVSGIALHDHRFVAQLYRPLKTVFDELFGDMLPLQRGFHRRWGQHQQFLLVFSSQVEPGEHHISDDLVGFIHHDQLQLRQIKALAADLLHQRTDDFCFFRVFVIGEHSFHQVQGFVQVFIFHRFDDSFHYQISFFLCLVNFATPLLHSRLRRSSSSLSMASSFRFR